MKPLADANARPNSRSASGASAYHWTSATARKPLVGMSGALVWDKFQEGGIKEIRDYCETDVLNTWLVYLRFEHMRGNLDDKDLEREFALVRGTLEEMNEPHTNEFLQAWSA